MEISMKNRLMMAGGLIIFLLGFWIVFFDGSCGPSDSDLENAENRQKNGVEEGGFFSRLFSFTPDEGGGNDGRASWELTDKDRKENEREIKRMMEKIPGNMWIPRDLTEEEQKEQRKMLRDIVLYGNKIRKGTATKEEKKIYYGLKSKQVADKIEFVEYIIGRVAELKDETGETYLDDDIISQSKDSIKDFRAEYEKYLDELNKL